MASRPSWYATRADDPAGHGQARAGDVPTLLARLVTGPIDRAGSGTVVDVRSGAAVQDERFVEGIARFQKMSVVLKPMVKVLLASPSVLVVSNPKVPS